MVNWRASYKLAKTALDESVAEMLRRTMALCLVLLHVSHALLLAPRAAAATALARGGTARCSALRGLTMLDAEETAKRVLKGRPRSCNRRLQEHLLLSV